MPYGPPQDNITVSPYYPEEGTGSPTQPHINYWPGTLFEPEPCSCGRKSRHLWLTHWFRLFYMKERW